MDPGPRLVGPTLDAHAARMVLAHAMHAMLLLSDPTPDPFVGPRPAQEVDDEDPLAELEDATLAHQLAEPPAPYEDPLVEPEYAPASDPPPERKWDGGMYMTVGLAPMSTLHTEGFHPGLRFDVETGMAWKRGRAKLLFGPDFHIMQYYGRKKPGFGVDAMATLSLRHVYARVGAGTAMRIPTRRDLEDTRPMMGGLVGGGLVGRLDHVEGRLGVDYDVRIDTTGRVAQTVLVTMRVSFGP